MKSASSVLKIVWMYLQNDRMLLTMRAFHALRKGFGGLVWVAELRSELLPKKAVVMSQTPPTEQQMTDAVYSFAAEQLVSGQSPDQVKSALIERGMDSASAGVVVNGLVDAQRSSQTSAAIRNIVVGGLFCVGGTVITIATYSAAAQGGGRYVVFWGAIVFGFIQFIRGIGQLITR